MNDATHTTGAAPVSLAERIHALDTTRGFAVLGILIMNIWSFAGPQAFYDYPLLVADWGGAPVQTWTVMHTLFEGSQRALFSMLFGAGMLLMVNRLDERATGVSSARLYYRRLFFLMLFGLFDLFVLLWPADILFVYGLCGLVLYPLRRCRPITLVALALVVFSAQASLRALDWQEATQLQQEFGLVSEVSSAPRASLPDVNEATDASNDAEAAAREERRKDYESREKRAHPSMDEEMAEQIRLLGSGDFGEFVKDKLVTSVILLIVVGLKSLVLDSIGAMLIGMALLRSGILQMRATTRTYVIMLVIGYGVGLPVAFWETGALMMADFDFVLRERNLIHYDLRRMAVGMGHLAAILLFCRAYSESWLATRMAAVGRMALSNYLSQSILCGFIFYTVGLGYYGQFTGYYLYMVVLGIWIVQIAFSNWWLGKYRFGPAEWLWKSLTYKQRQPLVK